MSVNIPISADASQIVSAIDAIRDALRRSGQEAKAFRDLDLSHPELSGFAADLSRVQRQVEDLMRVSTGGTARAARRVYGSPDVVNPLDFGSHDAAWERHYSDPTERARLRERAESYMVRGTQFAAAPPRPPPSPTPLPPTAAEESSGRQRWQTSYSNEAVDAANDLPRSIMVDGFSVPNPARTAARTFAQTATFGLSLAGINGIRGTIAGAYHGALDENQGTDSLLRSLGSLSQGFESLRDSVRKASEGLLVTHQEALRMERLFASINGDNPIYGRSVVPGGGPLSIASGMATGWGISQMSAMSGVARAEALGMSAQQFATLIGDAAAQGMQTGNIERVQESMLRYMEQSSRLMVTAAVNPAGYMSMWTAMNASGNPGMRGDGATSLIGTIDEAVRHGGGGGDASTALTWRALRRYGITDPLQMQRLQERGMFADLGDSRHTTLFDAVREQAQREYGPLGDNWVDSAVGRHFNLTMDQAHALLHDLKPVDIQRTANFLRDNNLGDIAPTAYADIARVLGGRGNLDDTRDEWLRTHDGDKLTQGERSAIQHASGEDLRRQLALSMARHGTVRNAHNAAQQADVDVQNRLTELGQGMVAIMTPFKQGIADLTGGIQTLADFIKQFLTTGPQPGTGAMPFLGGDTNAAIGVAYRMMVGGAGAGGIARASFNASFGGGSGGPVNVAGSIPVADRSRILADATSGTMVPPDLLDALISQESAWRPDVQRPGGSDLGLGQITDSTGNSPGFGMSPISRADRLNPTRNAHWTAQYLEARGRALGLTRPQDWNDPNKVAAALRAYNGGGDPDYAARVMRRMRHHARPISPTQPIQASFEPLTVTVVHQDPRGRVLREETLTTRPLRSPTLYGVA